MSDITISRATIAKHDGWLALWAEKKRGVFCYYDKGVFKRENGTEIEYEKIRLADVVVTHRKKGDDYIRYAGRGAQKYSHLGFYPELAPYVREIIAKIYEEVFKKPASPRVVDDKLRSFYEGEIR